MRIRTIKPEFFTHEGLFDLEQETKLPVRLAFIGLWCFADREGRFRWEPRRIGAAILPYDQSKSEKVLDALWRADFVLRYGDRQEFAFIPSFSTHQRVNIRETPSVLPEPPEAHNLARACTCITSPCTCTHMGKGIGREGKGNGMDVATTNDAKPSWSLPQGWSNVSEAQKAEWLAAFPACDIDRQLAAMTAWLVANPKKAHKSNWSAFAVGWLKRSQDRGGDLFSNRPAAVNASTKAVAADQERTYALKPEEEPMVWDPKTGESYRLGSR